MSFVGPIQCKVDMTGFNRGFELAMQVTKRTPAQAANRAALEVAITAQKDTPFVTPETVDTELAVLKAPVIGASGRILKKRKNFFGKVGTAAKSEEVPLAVLIIAARARPGSYYNQLTNNRYALASWPFKGLPRRAGAWLMASLVDQMIKARHRSGHFLAAGWITSIRVLLLVDKGRGGGIARPTDLHDYGTDLGSCQPAKANSTNTACVIENDVGLEGQNAESNNRALVIYGMPALQEALDREGRKNMEYFLSKVGKEELENPVNRVWG